MTLPDTDAEHNGPKKADLQIKTFFSCLSAFLLTENILTPKRFLFPCIR